MSLGEGRPAGGRGGGGGGGGGIFGDVNFSGLSTGGGGSCGGGGKMSEGLEEEGGSGGGGAGMPGRAGTPLWISEDSDWSAGFEELGAI